MKKKAQRSLRSDSLVLSKPLILRVFDTLIRIMSKIFIHLK